jgi:hypothetical protein
MNDRIKQFDRIKQLAKLPKAQLAQMHAANGGLMGLATYMKWTKDELVDAVAQDEGLDPWSAA